MQQLVALTKSLKRLNLDLGISQLLIEWKKLFSTKYLLADISAGVTVACIAIPLSLAIALASGVSPNVGLVTAIIAGIICALFGGTPLAVSGPAAAMSILLANNVEKFGFEGLVLMCLIAGLMQLFSGIIGIGKLARFVPLTVVAGFTAGIGVIILIGQLPRAFGLLPPQQSHIFNIFTHIFQYFHQINLLSCAVVLITLVIIRGLPKIFPRIPASLVAILIPTLIVQFFSLNSIPVIGDIPGTLPLPHLPKLTNLPITDLFANAFTIYLLASLETLLSSSAVDKLAQNAKHDPNQELIGQGLGNIAVSFFGGIPVTGVIARSALNVQAGAKTRRASIIHAVVILLAVFIFAPFIRLIPIAALAGVLFNVAFSMISVKEFINLWKTSRSEGFIYAATFFTIIFVDLIAGVQIGVIAASLIVLLKAARTELLVSKMFQDDILRLSLSGALTFLSSSKLADLEKELQNISSDHTVILDLSKVTNMDTSGATAVIDLFNYCSKQSINFYIKGLPTRFEPWFKLNGGSVILDNYYLVSEKELKDKSSGNKFNSFRGRLIHGVQRFYAENKQYERRLFDYIAVKQDPHTLFITCSDSRIIPSLITSTDPGELFIIRNVGNFIPPYNHHALHSEAAAIEFAFTQLNITDIVVCGHSNCGAIKASCDQTQKLSVHLEGWISMIRQQLDIQETLTLDEIARANVLNQIVALKNYPVIQKKFNEQRLTLHGWFFDVEHNLVYEWDNNSRVFKTIVSSEQE